MYIILFKIYLDIVAYVRIFRAKWSDYYTFDFFDWNFSLAIIFRLCTFLLILIRHFGLISKKIYLIK